MKTKLGVILMTAVLAVTAGLQPLATASDKREVLIKADAKRVKAQLISTYCGAGWRLVNDSEFNLSFMTTLDPQSTVGQVVGYALSQKYGYSAPASFTIVPNGGVTRVYGQGTVSQARLENIKWTIERGH